STPAQARGSRGQVMGSATGLTAAGLERLHAAAERHVGDEKVPGLVALVACGDQGHAEAQIPRRGIVTARPRPTPPLPEAWAPAGTLELGVGARRLLRSG